MTSQRINPPSMYNSLQFGFSHAALDTANGVLHLAGQVAFDKDCNIVGGTDLAAQTRQALNNLTQVLVEAGSSIQDLLRIRVYVKEHALFKLGIVSAELAAFYGDVTPAPNTFIGVQSLALPDLLVEIEATAVLSR